MKRCLIYLIALLLLAPPAWCWDTFGGGTFGGGPFGGTSRFAALPAYGNLVWSTNFVDGVGTALDVDYARGATATQRRATDVRASGAYYFPINSDVLTYADTNVSRVEDYGLLREGARTNYLLNSGTPATQTTASLGTGTYTLWVEGSGSATVGPGTVADITGIAWNATADTMVRGQVVDGVWEENATAAIPIQEQIGRGLYVASTDTFTALDSTNSSLLENGTVADLSGASGDVMVRIPRHYQLWHRDGDMQYILTSERPFTFGGDTATVPACFGTARYYYISAFEGVLDDAGTIVTGTGSPGANTSQDKLRSLPGYKPWTNEYRSVYRTLARNTGGTCHQMSWDAYQMMVALMVTEWGSWDSQTELPGYTGASGWDYAYVRETGRTMTTGDASTSVLSDLPGTDSDLTGIVDATEYVANSWRGIENPYGHVWKFLDGINIDNTDGNCTVYTSADYTVWADDTATGYTDTGHAPGFGSANGYIADILGSGQYAPLYPSSITGGSSSTYLHDYHYNTSGGWRVLLAGGRLADGVPAGVACLKADNGSGNRVSHFGARLAARSTELAVDYGTATAASSVTFTLDEADSVDVTVAGSLDRFQLEAGSFATSYIPTTTATVTRATEAGAAGNGWAASITTDLNATFSGSAGTVLLKLRTGINLDTSGIAGGLVSVAGSATDLIYHGTNGYRSNDGTTACDEFTVTDLDDHYVKLDWNSTHYSLNYYDDGAWGTAKTAVYDGSWNPGAYLRLFYGNEGLHHFGWLNVYKARLTDAQALAEILAMDAMSIVQ